MKKLGVIGGLGAMATVHFLYLLTEMTDAGRDQEHMEIIMHSKPSIPDRTEFILGRSQENPLSELIRVGCELKNLGVERIAIPCITSCYFHEKLEQAVGIPVLHTIRETAIYLRKAGIRKAGILATEGTVAGNLFPQIFGGCGIETVNPDAAAQRRIMDLIYRVKAGRKGDIRELLQAGEELFEKQAEVVLLGCTELSLLKKENGLPPGYLDVLEVLARKTVMECGRIKGGYEDLITG